VTLLVTPSGRDAGPGSVQGRIQLTLRNQLDTLLIRTNGARASALFGPVRPAQAPQVLASGRTAPAARPAPATERDHK